MLVIFFDYNGNYNGKIEFFGHKICLESATTI